MNLIERRVWAFKVPKERRTEFYNLLGRQNIHEIRDMGNEDYVLNIVREDAIVDRESTNGELHIISASSKFNLKSLTYEMVFGETNEMIVSKSKDLYLTKSEDMALDKYITSFCSKIKTQLNYHVKYSIRDVEAHVYNSLKEAKQEEYNVVNMNTCNTKEGLSVNEVQKIVESSNKDMQMNSANTLSEDKSVKNIENTQQSSLLVNGSLNISLSEFYNKYLEGLIAKTNDINVSITAYYRNDEFGVSVDTSKENVLTINIGKDDGLTKDNKTRSMGVAICIAQAIGMFLRLQNNNYITKYFYYEDKDANTMVPEEFNNISEVAKKVQHN